MRCLKCQHNNREDANYCEECGAKLQLICPKCRSEQRPQAKFCDKCGTILLAADSSAKRNDRFDSDDDFAKILERLAKGEISAETADKLLQTQISMKKIASSANLANPDEDDDTLKASEPYVIRDIARNTKKGSANLAVDRLKLVTQSWRRAKEHN